MKVKHCVVLMVLMLNVGYVFGQNAWRQLNVNNSISFQCIYFISGTMGWAIGDQGGMYKTIDGGESWSQINLGYHFFSDMSYAYSGDLWLITQSGAAYKSQYSSGYETWDLMHSVSGDYYFSSIRTNNLNHMFMIGEQIWKTTDSGASWNQVNVPVAYYSDMGFIGELCVLIGNQGAILKSTDSGETWTPISGTIINNTNLYSIEIIDFDTWIIVGADGKIFRTENGGSSFNLIESNTSTVLRDIKWLSSGVLMIACDDGTVLKTTDNGLTWVVHNYGFSSGLYSIARTAEPMLQYACGHGGKVLKTESQGEIPYLNVSPNSLNFQANENLSTDFDIDANTLWSISCSDSWFSCNFTGGQNNFTIDVSVDINTQAVSRTGTISVTGSGITRDITVNQSPSAAIENLSYYGISVFPNPVNKMLYIENIPANLIQIRFVDLSGRCLLQQSASEVDGSIELDVLPSGMYFIIFDMQEKQAIGKICVQ